jgi:hypothetical protein
VKTWFQSLLFQTGHNLCRYAQAVLSSPKSPSGGLRSPGGTARKGARPTPAAGGAVQTLDAMFGRATAKVGAVQVETQFTRKLERRLVSNLAPEM